jgi:hypothetical protein
MNLRFIEEELGKSTWFAGEEVTGAGPYPACERVDDCRYHDELSRATCAGTWFLERTAVAENEGVYCKDGSTTGVPESSRQRRSPRNCSLKCSSQTRDVLKSTG